MNSQVSNRWEGGGEGGAIVRGGLEKILKTNSQEGWNSRGGWKNLENLIAKGFGILFFLSFFFNHKNYLL